MRPCTIDKYISLELPCLKVLEAKKDEPEFMLKLKVRKVVLIDTAVEIIYIFLPFRQPAFVILFLY